VRRILLSLNDEWRELLRAAINSLYDDEDR